MPYVEKTYSGVVIGGNYSHNHFTSPSPVAMLFSPTGEDGDRSKEYRHYSFADGGFWYPADRNPVADLFSMADKADASDPLKESARVRELLEANTHYQQEARSARIDAKNAKSEMEFFVRQTMALTEELKKVRQYVAAAGMKAEERANETMPATSLGDILSKMVADLSALRQSPPIADVKEEREPQPLVDIVAALNKRVEEVNTDPFGTKSRSMNYRDYCQKQADLAQHVLDIDSQLDEAINDFSFRLDALEAARRG